MMVFLEVYREPNSSECTHGCLCERHLSHMSYFKAFFFLLPFFWTSLSFIFFIHKARYNHFYLPCKDWYKDYIITPVQRVLPGRCSTRHFWHIFIFWIWDSGYKMWVGLFSWTTAYVKLSPLFYENLIFFTQHSKKPTHFPGAKMRNTSFHPL